MSPVTIVLLVILAVLIIGLVVLYFLGKKAQKKKAEQDEQLAAAAQTVSMLIIDKKRMKLKDANAYYRIWSSTGCDRPDTKDDAPYQTSDRKSKGWTESYVFDRR